jgi:hypothetical protein
MALKPNKKIELVVFGAGLLCLAIFAMFPLIFPDPADISSTYLNKLRFASGTFYGASATDIATDIVGMRALVAGTDPYPILGPALKELGLDWDLDFSSPRLPTGYLFTAPVFFLPWPFASAIWSLLMIACWTLSLRLLGLSWNLAIGIGGLLLLWPPAMMSLGQLTAVWLLLLTLAYTWRANPARAGSMVALSAMTKYTPAVALISFVTSSKRGRILIAFSLTWLAALTIIVLLNPYAVARYWEVNQSNSLAIAQRLDNAAPFAVASRFLGWVGVVGWTLFLGSLVFVNWHSIRANTQKGWMVTFYLAVALLPVLWIYSLLPLLPVAWHTLTGGNNVSKALTVGAVVLTFLGPAFGAESVPYVSAAAVLFGLALFPQQTQR